LVALSLRNAELPAPLGAELLPPITPYFVMKVGHVPLIDYHRPGDPEVAKVVASTLHRYAEQDLPLHAVMLSRLGPNVWHDTPAQAMATLEELEETARLQLLCPGPSLTAAQIDELRQTFGAHW
jgi:ribulose-5-phosphate 4-epimerase/fuculose-1-phosphate aldolase